MNNGTEAVVFDWKTSIQDLLHGFVASEELPENSLYLLANYERNGQKVTSYSICIYEPDYPSDPNGLKDSTKNSIVLNIKENGLILEVLISKPRFGAIGAPEGIEFREIKSDKVNMHLFFFLSDLQPFLEYIKKSIRYAYDHYMSRALAFGCCGQFNACSDARKCIHENKLYSKACTYRKHLEAGEIFYGKNRNVK